MRPVRNNATGPRAHMALLLSLLLLLSYPSTAADGSQAASAQPVSLPQEPGQPERLHLMVGRSLVINSPARLKRVSVADPNIADAIVVSPYQLLVNGKAPGGVSLVLWDELDQSQTFDLIVDLDIMGIEQKIREVFPQEPVRVEASKDLVMLSGRMSSKAVADRILAVVSAITPKVISLMDIPEPPPPATILLEVKFAEVNRRALLEHGVNFFSLGAAGNIGTSSTQQFAGPQLRSLTRQGSVSENGVTELASAEFRFTDLLNIFIFRPDLDLGTTIRAMEQKNLLQILAEPNLLTQGGKEASFLAGGEFPFPILQSGTATNGITIQFKEFGVRLNFTPTQTAEGKIHLKVAPEVSALDFANALTISGFQIPAISTRRVETEMELEDGQTFAIAGLVDDRVTEVMSKIPGIGDIPILGYLFRSRHYSRTKTELLVMVTPRLVKPLPAGEKPAGPNFPKPFLPPAEPGKKPAQERE